uniref:CYRIA/CYRIB Rac1 binding domain-containing protein n=3 Tax=Ascarididae TaxID=6250 RepID=A0A915C0X5_PARUN
MKDEVNCEDDMRSGASCAEVLRSVLLAHCDGSRPSLPEVAVFLDFENASPCESELHLFSLADKVLEQAGSSLEDVASYGPGASVEIRLAIQQPNNAEAQSRALDLLDRLVAKIRMYYELSQRIEQLVPLILWELCSGPLPPAEQLEALQATCRQFARLIDFVLSFDALKMCTPALQNDFSFYRRTMSRETGGTYVIPIELTNTISLFLASPTPMLSALTTATIKFVVTHSDLPVTNTTDTLATIVQACHYMVETEENWERMSEFSRLFTVRVMVGAIILYDHIDNAGVFCRESPIDIRSVVELIKAQPKNDQVESLLNALRYTTKHLNDGSTPKSVRALFP